MIRVLQRKHAKTQATHVCMGVNAGAFHVVMANQLGLMQKVLNWNKTRDGQIGINRLVDTLTKQ